jgi:tape measure domain-containing protein
VAEAGGIEFLIELEAKLDGAVQASSAMRKLMQDAEKADRALDKSGKAATGAFEKVRGAIAGAAKGFNVAGGKWLGEFAHEATSTFTGMFAATAVWDALKEGAHLAVELTKELFEAAGEAERTERAFKNMLGDEGGDELLASIDRITKHTEFTDGPIKAFSQNLIDAGFAGENLANAMSATFDVAARSPNKLEGASGAIGALERLMLTGTADARTLRALKISPRALYAQMAKDLGMGQKEVEKKLGEGKIRTQDVLNSVFKALAGRNKSGMLGTAGADMATTFLARLEHLKDVIPNIFEEMSKTGGFSQLSDSLGAVADDLAPDGRIGKLIVSGLTEVFDQVAGIVGGVDWASGAMTLVGVLKEVVELAKSAGSFFNRLGEGYEAVADTLSKVAFLGDRRSREQRRTDEVKKEFRESAEGRRYEENHREFVRRIREQRAGRLAVPYAPKPGPWLPDAVIDGLSAGTSGKAEQKGVEVGKSYVKGAAKGLGVQSPSKEFMRLGELSAEGYGQGLEMAAPSLSAKTFLDGISPAAAGPGRTGGVSVSAPVTINLYGTETTPDQVREIVRIEVPSSIVGALEQLGLQTGSA